MKKMENPGAASDEGGPPPIVLKPTRTLDANQRAGRFGSASALTFE